MNYLAHIFLSGDDPEIMLGNFIGDHVKGKSYTGFSSNMIKGIELHRAIDTFTDAHPVVHESKARLRPLFHKYAPVIADVFYDHYLAINWNRYSDHNLYDYTLKAYAVIRDQHEVLPQRAQYMFSYMEKQNWLYHYATLEGIHKALSGMSRRTAFDSGMEKAAAHLKENKEMYAFEFELFFPELQAFCAAFLIEK